MIRRESCPAVAEAPVTADGPARAGLYRAPNPRIRVGNPANRVGRRSGTPRGVTAPRLFGPDKGYLACSRQKAMAMAPASDTISDNQPADHNSQEVPGMYFLIRPSDDNGQAIKIIYLLEQLREHLYPAFAAAFRVHGFDAVPWKDMLYVMTVGGEIDLKGKKFFNRKTYVPQTMDRVFMQRERALVSELMTTVFNNRVTLSYMRELTPFEQVAASLQFDASIALRKTVLLFQAVDGSKEDTYRVIIEGEGAGDNLRIHRFKFQPSRCWHRRRYPEDVK